MKPDGLKKCYLPFYCILYSPVLLAQHKVDTLYIGRFERSNTIELFTGKYNTGFDFSSAGNSHKNFKLVGNSNFYSGAYLSYHWFSAMYSWALPHTYLDNKTKFKYTSLEFTFKAGCFILHPYYDSYNGLLEPLRTRPRRYNALRDITFSQLGTDVYYYTNRKKFSSLASFFFSEKQLKSAGAVYFKLNSRWQKTTIKEPASADDSILPRLLIPDKKWVAITGSIGYNYNFVRGKWCVSPLIDIGAGAVQGVSARQDKAIRDAYAANARFMGGYNGDFLYTYINANWQQYISRLDRKTLFQSKSDISLTVGYRVAGLHKKAVPVL